MIVSLLSVTGLVLGATIKQPRELQIPNSEGAKILEVMNLSHLETKYGKLLATSENTIFHLIDTKTFVAKRNNDYWDLEENLDDLSKIEKTKKHEVSWVEFGFQRTYITKSENRIPVSHCHSETEGQGGALNIQSSVGVAQSLTGSFGVNPNTVAFSLSLTASVALELSLSVNTVLGCSARHGEIVQLFLVDTKFVYYTPKVRMLIYDKKKGKLLKAGQFENKKQRRAVVRGGIGEWICGSSTVIPLECSQLSTSVTEF